MPDCLTDRIGVVRLSSPAPAPFDCTRYSPAACFQLSCERHKGKDTTGLIADFSQKLTYWVFWTHFLEKKWITIINYDVGLGDGTQKHSVPKTLPWRSLHGNTAASSLVVCNVCMTQDTRDISHIISFNIYNNSGEHSSLYFTEDKRKSHASQKQTQEPTQGWQTPMASSLQII